MTALDTPFYIGKVRVPNRLCLGPMAGVTDLTFRQLCREQGCGLVCTEMVSAKAIFYNNRNTGPLMETGPDEHPAALQLFGSEPELMGEMARKIEHLPFDILDINMGCPVPKVVNNGEGSALMKDPLLAGRIIESVAKATVKPVTVKIRKGFDMQSVNAPEIARIAQESGAAAVAVHGRTRTQYYSGSADWEIIRQVREKITIPLIGNGDVTGPETAHRMMEETGCDAVMIGRAAQGDPWIFSRILNEDIHSRPEIPEMTAMILRHARMLAARRGEASAVREMRKHVGWYTAGYPDSAALRRKANTIMTLAELEVLLREYTEKMDC